VCLDGTPCSSSALRRKWRWRSAEAGYYCWTSSTRRFWALPASSLLEATGESEAMPLAVRRVGATW
jgi:hypothetical protein